MRTGTGAAREARSLVGIGHVLVGSSALVFAVVLISASRAPHAELEGVLIVPGLLLAVAAAAFTFAALLVLQGVRHRRHGSLSLILSVIELAAGCALAWGLAAAWDSYGVSGPWRSPLLLPTVVLLGLGLWGVGLEMGRRRP